MSQPRPEYPRPQFVRANWLCLNGEWEFAFDFGDSGHERGLTTPDATFSERITVPFCPESPLSGIANPDFLRTVWYRRAVPIPADWTGQNVLLHFGAVDYDTTVWVNGKELGRHRGGFTPFTCDLRGVVAAGETATIVVRARDTHPEPRARGKQSNRHGSYSCFYTRTTGIWQTVWLEPVADISMKRPRITPDVANSRFEVQVPLFAGGPGANRPGLRLRATLTDGAGTVVTAETRADLDLAPRLILSIPEDRVHLWAPGDGFLYGLTLELVDRDGNLVDKAESYAGLRSVSMDGKRVLINGKPVFQRLILDQGYWPDGNMTAPTDDELKADIERSLATGFNGARLHQKVFEERFLYWADKLGYLVWGEFGDWGCAGFGPSQDHQKPDPTYITQWLESLERDYSHPSIVGWCGLNETYQENSESIKVLDDVTRGMYLAAKAMDTSRPVLDSSGYAHRVPDADIYDSHDYEQDPVKFAANQGGLAEGNPHINKGWDGKPTNIPYNGQPYFCSEFGGIWWNPAAFENKESWGYGERVKTIEEFYARFEGLCKVLLDDPNMFGYCYTQLTDIYPEENGLYTFDRQPKFDNARLKAVQDQPAAIEKTPSVD